jgi:putative modified peptide
MEMRKVGPKPLDTAVADRLLDLLSTDDDFRALFVRDANAALEVAGYVHADPTEAGPGQCLDVSKLASKDSIARDREKIKGELASIFGFMAPPALRG